MFKRLFTLCLLVALTGCAAVSKNLAVRDGHVEAQLIAETLSVSPGKPLLVAVRLSMDPHWHTYWKNPGDSGTPTHIQWTLPEGFKAGEILWPYPDRIIQPPLTGYGYEDTVLLLTKIETPPSLNTKNITLQAKVDWLVCQVGCIPGKADLSLDLPVSATTPVPDPFWAEAFNLTKAKLPLEQGVWKVRAESDKKKIKFFIETDAPYTLSDVYFFPDRDDLINHADPQVLKPTRQGYTLEINRSEVNTQPLTQLKGVLYSQDGWRGSKTEQAVNVDVPVTPALTKQPVSALAIALVFAFIGGLILNLMPCVLPVLSLKILGLMKQSGEDKSFMRLHGGVFTFGVVLSFWLLAGLLILLRAGGQQIGWGFQFQSPGFVIFLTILFFLLALNLFGVFEILIPVQMPKAFSKGLSSSFFNGVLATLTATPCTAPFMGTALGFSLAQPPYVSFLVFTLLGLGMAFPYLLLTWYPDLLKFLPKPGPWMIRFKQFLGILMLGTVIWLLWVLGTQTGVLKEPVSIKSSSTNIWQSYSPELIRDLRAQNKTILLDFTAKWCLTCQVNERIALDNPEVVKKLKDMDVATVKADWTSYDPKITQALAELGKNSIPVYVLYSSNPAKTPVLLPEIISPQTVLEALEKINS